MSTKIKICSDAALLVGSSPVASITDDTTQARLTLNMFEGVRDEMLRAHPWHFATKRVALSPLVGSPPFGFKFAFNTPADMLKFISVEDPEIGVHFKLESRKILANKNAINIIYIFRNEDISTWPPDFIAAVTYELASRIAYPITKSEAVKQSLEQKAQFKLAIAKINNGQENASLKFRDNPLLWSRY